MMVCHHSCLAKRTEVLIVLCYLFPDDFLKQTVAKAASFFLLISLLKVDKLESESSQPTVGLHLVVLQRNSVLIDHSILAAHV